MIDIWESFISSHLDIGLLTVINGIELDFIASSES